MMTLKRVTLSGYKSIREMDLELRPVNVLIGENGAGKSNLVSFFELACKMREGKLQNFVGNWGAEALLFYGAKTTQRVEAQLLFEDAGARAVSYRVRLNATARETLVYEQERIELAPRETVVVGTPTGTASLSCGTAGVWLESTLGEAIDAWRRDPSDATQAGSRAGEMILRAVEKWGVFHFHDTSATAKIRKRGYVHDDQKLHSDGSNLAAFLRGLQLGEPTIYHRIVETIQLIAPWFGDFVLDPLKANRNDVLLSWRDRYSDNVFGPHQLPDGALRAMALVTLLLQPEKMLPSLLVIDEPELGLHPYAINVLAGLVEGASHHCQVILATQSVALLEQFDPEDVVVVEREDGASTFRRLRSEELQDWLDDYSLGELWQKNVIGGGPA